MFGSQDGAFEWRQSRRRARIYYDLAGLRRLQAARVVAGRSQEAPLAVAVYGSPDGYVWHQERLVGPDEAGNWKPTQRTGRYRYLRIEASQASGNFLFLHSLEVTAEGEPAPTYPDMLRPDFQSQMAIKHDLTLGDLRLEGASGCVKQAVAPGKAFRLDLFFECLNQLSSDAPYSFQVSMRSGESEWEFDPRYLRNAREERSWPGLRFREMVRETVPTTVPPGRYDLYVDVGRSDAKNAAFCSLLPGQPALIGHVLVAE